MDGSSGTIRAIFAWPWKMVSVIVRYLFYQPMDEKIKTWPFRFPAKKNLIWRRHWSIGQSCCSWLQYDVKAKYRLISRKFSGMKFFLPECSINQPKATWVCIRSINQSNRFISVRLFFCFALAFSFQGHMKIALTLYKPRIYLQIIHTNLHTFPWRIRGDSLFKNQRIFPGTFFCLSFDIVMTKLITNTNFLLTKSADHHE